MIALSTTPVRHVAPWHDDPADAPTFFLRPGNPIEREEMEAELAGEHRAGRVWDYELSQALAAGVEALLAGEAGADELLAIVHASAAGEPLDAAEQARLAEVKAIVGQHWPDYRALLAQLARRRNLLPLVVFRRFCTGWDGLDVPFRRGPDGLVHLAALAGVPPLEMKVAGTRAYEMLYAGHLAGNSERRSTSDARPAISSTDEPSPAAGGSATDRAGTATPA